MKVIKDVLKNWQKMDGSTDKVKRINAFLTYTFISGRAPSDECVSYAEKIALLKEDHLAEVVEMLENSFNSGTDSNGVSVKLNMYKKEDLKIIAKKALAIND